MSRTSQIFLALCVAWATSTAIAHAQDTPRWEHVLRAHVSAGRVDYAALGHDAAARADLDAYVTSLAAMPDAAPLGAWIDAYNALVVHAIVRAYPIRSVRDVPGFFDHARYAVAGRERTLDEIENEVLRERFHDARVHAALVCGARSCPPLARTPYARRPLDVALDRAVRQLLQSERAVRVTTSEVWLSQIFDWFRADFARDAGSLSEWLGAHDRRFTPAVRALPVHFLGYDWALNAP